MYILLNITLHTFDFLQPFTYIVGISTSQQIIRTIDPSSTLRETRDGGGGEGEGWGSAIDRNVSSTTKARSVRSRLYSLAFLLVNLYMIHVFIFPIFWSTHQIFFLILLHQFNLKFQWVPLQARYTFFVSPFQRHLECTQRWRNWCCHCFQITNSPHSNHISWQTQNHLNVCRPGLFLGGKTNTPVHFSIALICMYIYFTAYSCYVQI